MPIKDERVQAYLDSLRKLEAPVIAAIQRAVKATGTPIVETPIEGGTRHTSNLSLNTQAAFDAWGASLKLWARTHRDVRSNERIIRDDIFNPPGFDVDDWKSLAMTVGADPEDAATPEGRTQIANFAVAAAQRKQLEIATSGTDGDKRIVFDPKNRSVVLDGKTIAIGLDDDCAILMEELIDAYPCARSFSEIRRRRKKDGIADAYTRIKAKLPRALLDLIESVRGKGTRLSLPA